MGLPEMNPLAAKLMGGADFRKQLREQLLRQAEQTADPAYRSRLIEVAEGRRPLRTLMFDPGFAAAHSSEVPDPDSEEVRELERDPESPFYGTTEEVVSRMEDKLSNLGIAVPPIEEAEALFPEVIALRERTEQVVRADQLNDWQTVHDSEPE